MKCGLMKKTNTPCKIEATKKEINLSLKQFSYIEKFLQQLLPPEDKKQPK